MLDNIVIWGCWTISSSGGTVELGKLWKRERGNKGEVKSLKREKEIGDGLDWLARERERGYK